MASYPAPGSGKAQNQPQQARPRKRANPPPALPEERKSKHPRSSDPPESSQVSSRQETPSVCDRKRQRETSSESSDQSTEAHPQSTQQPPKRQRPQTKPAPKMSSSPPRDPAQALFRRLQGMEELLAQHSLNRERSQSLLAGLGPESDPSEQLVALTELAHFLSISTEETLTGFKADAFIAPLVSCMRSDSDDVALLATRAITHLMDALPQCCAQVASSGAIPILCEKLLVIEYIDLAEQCLAAIDRLSADHAVAVLREGGLAAVLCFVDFFGTGSQRRILQIAASLCRTIPDDLVPLALDAAPTLTNFLSYEDTKMVDNAALCFARMIGNLCVPRRRQFLRQLGSDRVLRSLLDLLPPEPGVPSANGRTDISFSTQSLVLRTLTAAARCSIECSQALLELGAAPLAQRILLGWTRAATATESTPSSSGSPLATPPASPAASPPGISLVGGTPQSGATPSKSRGVPQPPNAHQQSMEIVGEAVRLMNDLLPGISPQGAELLATCEEQGEPEKKSGRERDRAPSPTSEDAPAGAGFGRVPSMSAAAADTEELSRAREAFFMAHPDYIRAFAQGFPALLQVYSAAAQAGLKASTLLVLIKTLHLSSPELLKEALYSVPISEFLAGLLHSLHPPAIAAALHMAEQLLQKLPEIFRVHLVREGVVSEVVALCRIAGDSALPSPSSDGSDPLSPGTVQLPQPLIVAAKAFFERNFKAEDALLTSDATRVLRRVADDLRGHAQRTPAQREATLREVCEALNQENGISTYELLSSGLADALLVYLTELDDATESARVRRLERVGQFLAVFGRSMPSESAGGGLAAALQQSQQGMSSENYLRLLVHKLQAALSQHEQFPLSVNDFPEHGLASGALNCMKMLQQPLKLALVRLEPSAPLPAASTPAPSPPGTTVLIEPLATVEAIEDFIQNKLLANPALRAAVGVAAELEGREDGDEGTGAWEDDDMDAVDEPEDEEGDELDLGGVAEKTEEIPPPDDSQESPVPMKKEKEKEKEEKPKEKEKKSGGIFGKFREARKEKQEREKERKEQEREKEREKDREKEKKRENKSTEEGSSSSKEREAKPPRLAIALGGKILPPQMPIFQAVFLHGWPGLQGLREPSLVVPRKMWEIIYPLYYQPIEGDSPPQSQSLSSTLEPLPETPPSLPATLGGFPMATALAALEKAFGETLESLQSKANLQPTPLALLRLLGTLVSANENHAGLCEFLANQQQSQKVGADSAATFLSLLSGYCPLNTAEFNNTKLANKVLRQITDPLLICAGRVQSLWCSQLMLNCSYLFPFPVRRSFFDLTSFGAGRALIRLQEELRTDGGRHARLQKQKIRLSRRNIRESAQKVMAMYGSHKAVLEFEYFDEVGTGLGPTLEFYTLVARSFQERKWAMWWDEDAKKPQEPSADKTEKADDETNYVNCPFGLFPQPINPFSDPSPEIINGFKFLGKFLGRALLDRRLVDLPLSSAFLKLLVGQSLCLEDLRWLRPDLHTFLLKALEAIQVTTSGPPLIDGAPVTDLCIDFTLPGAPDVPLLPDAEDRAVESTSDLRDWVDAVLRVALRVGVQRQVQACLEGLQSVLPVKQLQLFSPTEFDELVEGTAQPLTLEMLEEFTVCDHGYTQGSRAVRFLFSIISKMTAAELRKFVQFVTGAPRLPLGGLRNLRPPLTIVRKTADPSGSASPQASPPSPMSPVALNSDSLPSVMTCANYLKLPDYPSEEVMRTKLFLAMQEGQESFHLS